MQTAEIESVALATRPPPRYTEATLLTAMEGAGKLIEDDELRAAMAGKGLGTPATRAQIIENLIDQRYIVRDGKDLRPTRKAFDLMTLLKGLDVPELTAPELTGEWEFKLAQMERGKLKRDRFMHEIAGMTQKIVERAKSYESDTVPIEDPAQLTTPCPKCGKTVVENYRRFACSSCDFSIPKHPGSRSLEVEEVEELLGKGTIGPMSGFISKMGRPFSAVLKLTPEFKLEFDFGQGSDDGSSDEAVDFTGQQPLGPCPKCGGRVFEQPMNYLCERATGPAKTCDFRSGKVILQQPIRSHGCAARVHLEPYTPKIFRVPGPQAGWHGRLRVRAAHQDGRQGAGPSARGCTGSAGASSGSADHEVRLPHGGGRRRSQPGKDHTRHGQTVRQGRHQAAREVSGQECCQDSGTQGRQVGGLTHSGQAPRSAGCGRGQHTHSAHPGASVRAIPALGYARRMQRFLIIAGMAAIALGVAWPWLARLGLGRLPGDVHVERDGFSFYFPLTTSIVVSIVVSLLVWLLRR